MRLVYERILRVAEALREFGRENVRVLEDLDPQMNTAKMLVSCCSEVASIAMVANAVVSYVLSMRGEEYWSRYGEWICREQPRNVAEVIDSVKRFVKLTHRIAVKAKIARLERLSRCHNVLSALETRDLELVWKTLARCLGTSPDAKTVVFAVKMFYYTLKVRGVEPEIPFTIPIPVDRRVAMMTYLSGIVSGENVFTVKTLLAKPNIVIDAWYQVARLCSIPPLEIDTVLWLFGTYAKLNSIQDIENMVLSKYGSLFPQAVLKRLVSELFYTLKLR